MAKKRKYRKCFDISDIEQLRGSFRAALSPPEEEDGPSLPEGWSISLVDPNQVTNCLKHLSLKPGFVLWGYQFCSSGNGNGVLYAIPDGSPFPEPEECIYIQPVEVVPGVDLDVPKPPSHLDNLMDAFEGDGTLISYIEASMLQRELDEFGAMWHGCSWSTHDIIDSTFLAQPSPSGNAGEEAEGTAERWTWLVDQPDEWRPNAVAADDGTVVVQFITFSGMGMETLYRHTDTYKAGNYRAESSVAEIARGQTGYIF